MKVEVLEDADSVARAAAATIAADARAAIAARGRFALAVSGVTLPWIMLRALAEKRSPGRVVHVFQTDERVAPTDTRIGTLRTCEKACFSMHLCAQSRSTPCR